MGASGLDVFTAHGGRVEAARAAFGGADWIDLSTGIAPWAYPVADMADTLTRLPEPDALAGLERIASAAFGCADAPEVVAVPGTDLAMRVLARVLPVRLVAVVRPGYAGHAAAWPEAAAIPGIEAAGGHDCIVVADPANPDGRRLDRAMVARLVEAGTTLVIDEAYADGEESICALGSGRIVVLRSFGKFYGLPGLRLGFVVAAPDIAVQLRAALGDWPVSTLAVTVGTAAYWDADWQRAQAARISAAGVRLDAALAGFAIVGAAGLFRLIETSDAHHLFRHLAGHAILTRPFADRPDRLRLGLPADEAAADRLARALAEYRA